MSADSGGRRRLASWLAAAILILAAGAAAAGLVLRALRATGSGTLEITTVPPGAEVRVDGLFAGISPLETRGVVPGNHVVEALRSGYQPHCSHAAVRPGFTSRLDLKLEPLPSGAIEVTSDPPGAEVTLDGQARGPAPLTIERVPAGTHRLVVQRSRFAPWGTAVEVRPGQTVKAEARLEDTARSFLEAAVAADPSDMTPRGELLAYLVAVRDMRAAGDCVALGAGRPPAGEIRNADILGLHYFKQYAALPPELAAELRDQTGARIAALGVEDPAAAGKALDYLSSVALRSTRERPDRPRQAEDVVLAAARKGPGCLTILERALDVTLRRGEGRAAAETLAAGAAAKPGDAEHAGLVALAGLNRAKAQASAGDARSQLLAAASALVEKTLAGEKTAADRVLRARLRRLHGRILLTCGSPEQALAEQERALADLAPVKAKQAELFWPWRLERVRMLLDAKRVDDARAELLEIAEKSPEGPWREEARSELKRLPAAAPAN